MRTFHIGTRALGEGYPPFIVAEVGLNHNGSVERALRMVIEAKMAGADAIKFGIFKAAEFCRPDDPLYDQFLLAEMPIDDWQDIKDHCDRLGIVFFATPQNPSDLAVLLHVGVPCIKVGSDDLTNLVLIKEYASHGLPLILSTGMAEQGEVWDAMQASGDKALLCACTSEYPCPPESANVRKVMKLRHAYGLAGFSDHTQGVTAATLAVAYGACYIEGHFTLDHNLPGPDHAWSRDPRELEEWVRAIREAYAMKGSGLIEPTPAELLNRDKWRRASGQQLRGK